MESLTDALLAQLMAMGFDQQDILTCQATLASSGTPITVQSATEWLLQRQQSGTHTNTPTLTLGHGGGRTSRPRPVNDPGVDVPVNQLPTSCDFSQPLSSGSSLQTTSSAPVKSRLDFGEEKRRRKDEYNAKERDQAIKRAREQRLRDHKAKELVKQQIIEDRERKAERSNKAVVKEPIKSTAIVGGGATSVKTTPTQCRVQVRLLDGSVIRHSFELSSTLNDVCKYIREVRPKISEGLLLVQPFPRREYSVDEHSMTLQDLGLCPSASLVASKDSHGSPRANPSSSEPMDTREQEEPHSDSDMSDDDNSTPTDMDIQPHPPMGHPPSIGRGMPPNQGVNIQPHPPMGHPPPIGRGMPPNQGVNILPHPPMNMPHPIMNQPRPPMIMPGAQNPMMSFGGEGHKLGGKGTLDKGITPEQVSQNARAAAERRSHLQSETSLEDNKSSKGLPDVPSLEVLSIRCLARWSSVDYLPSCAALPPRVAQQLIMALAEAKQLHPKTLNAFLKCPIQVMKLDNYAYATNQLIEMLRYFPSLSNLSLGSCTLLTDKSMAQLLPYLCNLVFLNLNGCHQLSDDIFQSFKCNRTVEVIKLSHLKLSDEGVQLLSRKPLDSLRELDLSHTNITSRALRVLSQGAPCLEILNIENTKVSDVSSLVSLKHLHSLNISQCPLDREAVNNLAMCSNLTNLSLSQIIMDCEEFVKLKCLRLKSLGLPDRNYFVDSHMTCISEFPLTVLDLTGYCHVTDNGIRDIANITSLTQLSLARTKLTDDGMAHIEGLVQLKQLSLDNTLITDKGMEYTRNLVNIEELSVSDTKVSGLFLINGCLKNMTKLVRLNLVRTFVDDRGLETLCVPSLMMLSIDFTCATEKVSMETLRVQGCRSLEFFRNRNIHQPTEEEIKQQNNNPQVAGPGGVANPPHVHMDVDDADSDEDY